MISTSTNAVVELAKRVPAKASAVAVLMEKEGEPQGLSLLPAADREAVEALVRAKAVTGRANEVVSQLVTGGAGGAHRVLVVGLGDEVAAQSRREAGAAVAKYARRHKLESVALVTEDVE